MQELFTPGVNESRVLLPFFGQTTPAPVKSEVLSAACGILATVDLDQLRGCDVLDNIELESGTLLLRFDELGRGHGDRARPRPFAGIDLDKACGVFERFAFVEIESGVVGGSFLEGSRTRRIESWFW
jgi:hypothetical protein